MIYFIAYQVIVVLITGIFPSASLKVLMAFRGITAHIHVLLSLPHP